MRIKWESLEGSLIIVTPTGICIGREVSASRVNNCCLSTDTEPFLPAVIQNTQTFFYSEVRKASVSVFLSCTMYLIAPALSYTFAHRLFYWCCHTCKHRHRSLQIRVSSVMCSPMPYTFIWKCTLVLICNFQLLLMDMYLEKMFSKVQKDYAQPQNNM